MKLFTNQTRYVVIDESADLLHAHCVDEHAFAVRFADTLLARCPGLTVYIAPVTEMSDEYVLNGSQTMLRNLLASPQATRV